ncbi:ABC transporter permease [Caldisericum sp. AR60]|uniref:ABC transporter permease n=1 Tax=Caldisericum sp. AR60 TaxID=3397852 RepID=UPI0039FCDCE6
MKALFELTKVQFKLTLRNFVVAFFSFAFPVFMLLMFGGIYGNKPTPFYGGHGTVDVMVPSYVGMIIAVTGLMNLPLTIAEYRDRKILKRFMATPLKPYYIIVSQVMVNFVTTLIGLLLLVITGKLVFNLHYLATGPSFILAFLLSIFSIFSFGFLIASIAPNALAATAIANLVYFPMLFLSGATIPFEVMPKIMISISKIVPLTYVVDLLKNTWLGSNLSNCTRDIIVLFIILIVSFFISALTFKWE